MQLFCFTYAGGTSDFYNQLEEQLSSVCEVIKLEYSGHGKRRKERLYYSFVELVEDLYPIIKEKYIVGTEYCLIGYSMGSIAVSAMLQCIIEKKELPLPKHVFLAAHEPQSRIEMRNLDLDEIEEYVKERTIQFGGIPEKLVNNNSFWRVYLPVYRADYSMIAGFDFENFKFSTQVPATVFYSETDTPYKLMKDWKKYYTHVCEFIEYKGSHFFINQHCEEMAEVINKRIHSIP